MRRIEISITADLVSYNVALTVLRFTGESGKDGQAGPPGLMGSPGL